MAHKSFNELLEENISIERHLLLESAMQEEEDVDDLIFESMGIDFNDNMFDKLNALIDDIYTEDVINESYNNQIEALLTCEDTITIDELLEV